jgi:hypothetical protein
MQGVKTVTDSHADAHVHPSMWSETCSIKPVLEGPYQFTMTTKSKSNRQQEGQQQAGRHNKAGKKIIQSTSRDHRLPTIMRLRCIVRDILYSWSIFEAMQELSAKLLDNGHLRAAQCRPRIHECKHECPAPSQCIRGLLHKRKQREQLHAKGTPPVKR